jgi:hypothetical protein
MPGTAGDWAALCGQLPDHQTAVMDGYPGGQPSVAEQNVTHGAPAPAVDRGQVPGTVNS